MIAVQKSSVSDESNPQPPHVVLFSGSVQLDGEESRVAIGQLCKQGFLQSILAVKEPEIRPSVTARMFLPFSAKASRIPTMRSARGGHRVAGGIVGEVEEDDEFVFLCGFRVKTRFVPLD
jgi:hypothetical protein